MSSKILANTHCDVKELSTFTLLHRGGGWKTESVRTLTVDPGSRVKTIPANVLYNYKVWILSSTDLDH